MKKFYLMLFIVAVILIAPIGVYLHFFNSQNISDQTSNWGSFGDFLSPFISIVNLIVVAYFSYIIVQLERNRDKLSRPILQVNTSVKAAGMMGIIHPAYTLKNIGKSPAFKIRVKVFDAKTNSVGQMGDLGENDQEPFYVGVDKWNYLEISYEDIFEKEFSMIFRNPQEIGIMREEDLDTFFPDENCWAKLKRWWRS